MANYTLGDMVFDARMERGYSQEELSFGICAVSSVSRIESGQQVPTKRIFDALMQRLGISDSFYSAYISREEMELYRLMRKMMATVARFDYEEMEELIAKAEKTIQDKESLEWQYVLFAKSNLYRDRDKNLEGELRLLLGAIKITMPDFTDKKPLKRELFTFDEIEILVSIAINMYDSGKQWDGLRILWDLKDYLEERIIDEEEKAKMYPMILYNISRMIGPDFKRHEDVVDLCDLGIECCIKYNKLLMLPYLVNNKACAVAELGNIEKAGGLFQQAYSLFKICKKDDFAEIIKNEISNRYNILLN